MITTHVDEVNKILEVTVANKVVREDLAKALSDLERPLKDWEQIRVLKRVDSFTGIEASALVDDFKFVFKNFGVYKKISKLALVTDKDWVEKVAALAKFVIPGEIRVFEQEDIEEARAWLK